MTVSEAEVLPDQHVGGLRGVPGGHPLAAAGSFRASHDHLVVDLLAGAEAPGTARAARVNALRLLVAAGAYRIDTTAVARSMLRTLLRGRG